MGPWGPTWTVPAHAGPHGASREQSAPRGTTAHECAPILGALVYVLNKSQQHSYWKKDHLNTTGFMVLPHIGTYGNLLKEIIPSFLVQKKSKFGPAISVRKCGNMGMWKSAKVAYVLRTVPKHPVSNNLPRLTRGPISKIQYPTSSIQLCLKLRP